MRKRESIDELLNANEGEHYQFKEWKSKDDFREAAQICCALANCGGGKLVLGVTDKHPRKVVGSTAFPQPERTRVDLMNKLRIRIDFYTYQHENGRVLVFDVASRPIGLPVQADGGAWWYQGDSLILMPEDVRRSIYAESGHDFSGDICLGATIDDLDSGAIKTFRKTWREYSGNKRIANLSQEQLLSDCGALTDDGLTYAALVWLGKRETLKQHLPHAEIIFEYRAKESAGPAAQRVEFHNGFFNSYERIWELVNLRNDQQHYQDGFHVFPVYTFNERVVRESVLNAVSHRNYQLAGSIFVRQYNNRVVIENPGGFPTGITVENILDKQAARNYRITEIFKLCGLVERAGQGMNLIYETAVKEAKPLPDFSGSDAYFIKPTLHGKVIDTRMLAMIKKIGDERLEAMTTDDYIILSALFHGKGIAEIHPSRFEHLAELGIVNQTERGLELANGDLTVITNQAPIDVQSTETVDWQSIEKVDRKQMIADFIESNSKATSSQIAKLTKLSPTRVRELLQELVAEGVIEKIGNYRYARYTMKNTNE